MTKKKKAKEQLHSKIREIIMNHRNNNKEDCINLLCSLENYHTKEKINRAQANNLISKYWKNRKHNRSREFR